MPGAYGWRSSGSGGCRATDRIFHLPDSFTGLSPLARGTPQAPYRTLRSWRFISARAGNTGLAVCGFQTFAVYPRSRGEHFFKKKTRYRPPGLSPHSRGTHWRLWADNHNFRFIPALAGNTFLRKRLAIDHPVYPRTRGEHIGACGQITTIFGLSPLSRGTRQIIPDIDNCARFIPARAGNTKGDSGTSTAWAVYPRSRGEHGFRFLPARVKTGLSPLARGTLSPLPHQKHHKRFIPARAGNT